MNMIISQKTLHLGMISSDNGLVAPQIYFTVSSTRKGEPYVFNPKESRWKMWITNPDYYSTNDLFNRLQDIRIAGKRLPEFIHYNGISMWQFTHPFLLRELFMATQLVDIIPQIIEETTPCQISVFPTTGYTDPVWRGIIEAISNIHGIPVQFKSRRLFDNHLERLKFFLIQFGIGLLIRKVSNKILSIYTRWINGSKEGIDLDSSKGKKLLFNTFAMHWIKRYDDPRKKYDEHFSPIFPELKNRGWKHFIGIDCGLKPFFDIFLKLRDRCHTKEKGVRWNVFYAYGPLINKNIRKARKEFARKWNIIEKDLDFKADLQYKGVRLFPALEKALKSSIVYMLPRCVDMLDIADNILKKEKPDAIILTNETGILQKAIIIKAAIAKIPTIGLQHGMIFNGHFLYMHNNITTQLCNAGFIVPRITCVWGSFWKDNLTKIGHYPDNSVVITGYWKYDQFFNYFKKEDAAVIKQRFGVSQSKKIVLILTAGQNILTYIRECLKVIDKMRDAAPLIKLHPSDDYNSVVKFLQSAGYPKDILIKDQLVNLIFISDLVISQISTTVSESVLLDKPVVLVNFEKFNYAESYTYQYGICLNVTEPDDLSAAIDLGLNDSEIKDRLEKARSKFIEDYFFKTDGQAAKRVVEALESLMQ